MCLSIEYALVAQRIERCPAEAEVVGSNPAKRATFLNTLVLKSAPDKVPVSRDHPQDRKLSWLERLLST